VGWVNHRRGILIVCDLLQNGRHLRYVPYSCQKRLYAGCPSLSLHHDGAVYITNKIGFHDYDKAWVTAVDMRYKTLLDLAYYYVPRRPLSYGYAFYESGISKHQWVRSFLLFDYNNVV
jgi:hypothetical protein